MNNGTLGHGTELDMQSLTFDNLTSIPRRNNIIFLSDYLQEQHSYLKGYASEGLSSWNHMASSAPKTTQPEADAFDAFLLGTPVLKARVPAVGPTEDRPLISEGRKCATGSPTRTKERLDPSSAQADLTGRNVGTKSSFGSKEKHKEAKKRKVEHIGSDSEEHLERLQERRERRRLKKSIMKSPAKESDGEKENPARCTTSRKKGGKKDKTKSPNFALMHGFTATNVGKSRITLEPLLRNAGVFKKGRASCVLKTGKPNTRKRGDRDVGFSEARFLGAAKAKATRNFDSKSSSASSSSSDEVHKKKVSAKRKKNLPVLKKSKGIDKTSGGSAEDSNCGVADRNEYPASGGDPRPYDPANSIIWDIERESYVEESEEGCRQGTIVRRDVLPSGGDQEEEQDPIVETLVIHNPTVIKTPDDSLHPSHSASQVAGEHPKSGSHFSKYFLPENITTREADGHDLYRGRRSVTLPVPETPRGKPNRSMFRQSRSLIRVSLASPTISHMISLDLVDGLPRPYDAFSLADLGSVFEDATMELDDYGALYDGPDAPQEPDFRSRSDKYIAFEQGLHSIQHYMENPDFSISGNVMERDLGFEDPPMEPDECCQNIRMNFAHGGGCDVPLSEDWGPFDADDTGDITYEPLLGSDTFSRLGPSDVLNLSMLSVDGSSEAESCTGFSPTRLDHFSQGRSLLYGLDHGHTKVSNAEAEVAKILKQNHWLPHRL